MEKPLKKVEKAEEGGETSKKAEKPLKKVEKPEEGGEARRGWRNLEEGGETSKRAEKLRRRRRSH